ncbi:hypothetical protein MSG28_012078 [Choristoneura fumiferana]|uniref:Uncharacterized protein n=1 Tax=Choristoneura fumiferana TaxID=7141 RepID=A0ACC0KMQ3_CHOFU|nr:hypothetical protein MSG28_012078 [Choristoneura fumiferana]
MDAHEGMHQIKAQRAMERAMLGITLLDHISNSEIRKRTRFVDVDATGGGFGVVANGSKKSGQDARWSDDMDDDDDERTGQSGVKMKWPLLSSGLWNVCDASHSAICSVAVPVLLHCCSLAGGGDVFCALVRDQFHHRDARVRFRALEKVTVIIRFMDGSPIKTSLPLQTALATAFCYLISSMDDINVYVAQRATLYIGTIHDNAIDLLVYCLETQFDLVIVDRAMVLQCVYQLHNTLSDRNILSWQFFLNRFEALFLEAQINSNKSVDFNNLRELVSTDTSSEWFLYKVRRAHEALSVSAVNTLSASFGTKWPYKRTISAPATMPPQPDRQHEREKVYSRQYSAPLLKRKTSRFGLGQLLAAPAPAPPRPQTTSNNFLAAAYLLGLNTCYPTEGLHTLSGRSTEEMMTVMPKAVDLEEILMLVTVPVIFKPHRWIGAAIEPHIASLQAVVQQELRESFTTGGAQPTRYLRSQQHRVRDAPSADAPDGAAEDEDVDAAGGDSVEMDPFDMLDPVEILSKLPKDFYEKLEATKWQERKEALDALDNLLKTAPRLEPGDYADLVRALKKGLTKYFVGGLELKPDYEISCLAQQNSGMNYRLRYSRTDMTFKFSRKERTPTLKAGNALVTLLVLQVSMGDANHSSAGERYGGGRYAPPFVLGLRWPCVCVRRSLVVTRQLCARVTTLGTGEHASEQSDSDNNTDPPPQPLNLSSTLGTESMPVSSLIVITIPILRLNFKIFSRNLSPSTPSSTPSLQIELDHDSNEEVVRKMTGRRIFNVQYLFEQMKAVDHSPFNCSFKDMDFVKESRIGFQSTFLFKCKMCGKKEAFNNEKLESKINKNVVQAVVCSGSGFSQLDELCAHLDMPCIAEKTFGKENLLLGDVLKDISLKSMFEAGLEEKQMAIEKGNVDADGVPYITVVADASWGKRSYRTSNYNSLSGVACIIGYETKKVLFLGIRNSYCSVCAVASNKKIEVKKHKCFKNWSGSSTAMEADGVVEGGKRINYSLRGSYESRCYAAATKKHRESCSNHETDEHYGDIEKEPDMEVEHYEKRKQALLADFSKSKIELENIQKIPLGRQRTLNGSNNEKYALLRSDATRYGNENEPIALKETEAALGVQVSPCGLYILEEHQYLGASPDGVIDEETIVEIKCPASAANMTPTEAILKKKITFCVLDESDPQKIKLKQNHNYFYQVQGQLNITKKRYCIFVVWTPKGILFEKSKRIQDSGEHIK